jgi:predicted nucleic acid-binding protein
LRWLKRLPAQVAVHEEVLAMAIMELFGRGLGWIDAHLIASALVSGASLYTHDRALIAAAAELGVLAA